MGNHSPLDLAGAYLQDGDVDGALAILDAHLTQNPQDDEARQMRVRLLRSLSIHEIASPAEQSQPEQRIDQLTHELADIEEMLAGGVGESAWLWRNHKAHHLIKRAAAYTALRQFVQALRDYEAAETLIPSDPALPFNRGLICLEQGDLTCAVTLCREGWDRANDEMRAAMRSELEADQRYKPILDALTS